MIYCMHMVRESLHAINVLSMAKNVLQNMSVVISDVSFEVKKPLIVSLPGEGETRSLQPSSGRVSADLLSRLPGRLPHHPKPDGLSDVVRDRGGGHDRPGSPYYAGPVQLSGGLALCCQCPLLPSGLHSLEPR